VAGDSSIGKVTVLLCRLGVIVSVPRKPCRNKAIAYSPSPFLCESPVVGSVRLSAAVSLEVAVRPDPIEIRVECRFAAVCARGG